MAQSSGAFFQKPFHGEDRHLSVRISDLSCHRPDFMTRHGSAEPMFCIGRLKTLATGRTAFTWLSQGLDPAQAAAVKCELLFWIGSLLMLWIIGAASVSGFVLTAFFCLLTFAKVLRITLMKIIEGMPKYSRGRHYATLTLGIAFFVLVAARACYISMIIVDTGMSGGI
ncbi:MULTISPECIES: hypothetical protein [unclassified Rhizobium]|nr:MULTISPECIES: hypothetical protein [unclassified Rhizobium]MBO9102063.1 hypothetical protein [Rhizobium sp. L58/93]MBO9172127.1 hypothetical protein [Rhizobium sp. L245/93]QXZ88341.1 hypothetical protein J5287_30935 [Rhizobium sp. K1/93]QXZ94312.1 hypothetical protein J5280_30475 [Rhizobium sp. K15/93]QYA05797.1 hypothetical protein J5278_30175 [Rhizobium sp. B21/90]